MMVKKLVACVFMAALAGFVGCASGTAEAVGGKEQELAAREGAQGPPGKAAPLAEKYLLEGKLAEGEKALQALLVKDLKDDQARFGLGAIQFLQAYEHLGASLYKYGLRTEKSFLRPPPQVKEFLPQNPTPEPITSAALRQILQTYLDDLARAEATLALVKDPAVKLPLYVGRMKMDPFGQGKPISAAFLFTRNGAPEASKQAESLVVGLDFGDAIWLRGYCHVLMAGGELAMSLDGQRAFDCGAHLLFEKPETPFPFLLEKRSAFDNGTLEDVPMWTDALTFLHHLTRMPVKEPERCKTALAHLETAIGLAQEMWVAILAETDDDNEWIPNPKQTGVLAIPVTQEMIDTWLATLGEAELLLQGKKLLPFWRGAADGRGVNLRRVFTEPQKTFDPFEWIQGTAAAPYLEKGTITKLADPATGVRLNRAFGGPGNFAGFGFWFN